jgi:hypothetical protein
MRRLKRIIPLATLLVLAACGGRSPAEVGASTPQAKASPTPAAVDPELAQLQAMVPVDACTWLGPGQLAAVYPDLGFELRQQVEPRLSGYAWDSRCTWWAGVGTIAFAKDAPTHTVEIFVATPVSESKARANLASRRELAQSTPGFRPLPELGPEAYATTQTGVASLFFVRGGSEVQINVSDLGTPGAEKVRRALALARQR